MPSVSTVNTNPPGETCEHNANHPSNKFGQWLWEMVRTDLSPIARSESKPFAETAFAVNGAQYGLPPFH